MKGAKRARVWDPRLLPMDVARVIGWAMELVFRRRTLYVDGKYRLRGGAVVVANHTSFADPFLIRCVFWYRRVFLLASEEVMRGRVRGALLRGAGCLKIDRTAADLRAIRAAAALAREGRVLALFPQGGIRRDGDTDAVKAGAVLIALQAGVPIVPVYSRPPARWWQRRTVVVGRPLDLRAACGKPLPTMADLAALTDELQGRLAACKAVYDQREENAGCSND